MAKQIVGLDLKFLAKVSDTITNSSSSSSSSSSGCGMNTKGGSRRVLMVPPEA